MEPSFREKQSSEGPLYRGEAFPLDQTMIQQAGLNKSRRYRDLIRQHETVQRDRRMSFYKDLVVILGSIVALSVLITWIKLHFRHR